MIMLQKSGNNILISFEKQFRMDRFVLNIKRMKQNLREVYLSERCVAKPLVESITDIEHKPIISHYRALDKIHPLMSSL